MSDSTVLWKLENSETVDQRYKKELRIQLPEIFDPDSKVNYDKINIIDEFQPLTSEGKSMGAITNEGSMKTFK